MTGNLILTHKFSKINDIIRSLYEDDCEPLKKYDYFLRALKEILYFDTGNILFFSQHDTRYELIDLHQLGWNRETYDLYVRHYYKEDDIYPVFATKTPLVIRCTDIFHETRKKTDFYLTFMKPNGFEFSLECNIVLPADINCYGVVSLFRLSSKKNFSPEEVAILEIFQPHLSNLARKVFANTAFNSGARCCSSISGHIMIDGNFKVLSRSEDFRRIVERYSPNGGSDIEATIVELCKTMKYADADLYHRDMSFKLDRYPLFLEIMNAGSPSDPAGATYACNIYDIDGILNGCLSHLCKKRGLSPRESDIVSYQVRGYKIEEIAGALCISNSTVKKHLTGIYNKLHIESQIQLIKALGFGETGTGKDDPSPGR